MSRSQRDQHDAEHAGAGCEHRAGEHQPVLAEPAAIPQHEGVAGEITQWQQREVVGELGRWTPERLHHEMRSNRQEGGIGRVEQSHLQQQQDEPGPRQHEECGPEEFRDRAITFRAARHGQCFRLHQRDEDQQAATEPCTEVLDRPPAAHHHDEVSQQRSDHLHHQHDHRHLRH